MFARFFLAGQPSLPVRAKVRRALRSSLRGHFGVVAQKLRHAFRIGFYGVLSMSHVLRRERTDAVTNLGRTSMLTPQVEVAGVQNCVFGDGGKLALERRFGRPGDAKLALEWRFGGADGAKLALERYLRRPGGKVGPGTAFWETCKSFRFTDSPKHHRFFGIDM